MKFQSKRHMIQTAAAALMNGFVLGFKNGKLFKGPSKSICVPVLNCYSCPGALGACPIGSLQTMLSGQQYRFSFYVLGFLMLFGIVLGRTVCGFLCPFGLIQGVLYKIPLPKIRVAIKPDKFFRYFKYAILLVFVILLPLFLKDQFGIGSTYFCKYICPAGTLEAGIPMLLRNPALRTAIGALFYWKVALLIFVVVLSILIYRPFCKYFCPLGAIYSLFNQFSLYQMGLDKSKCVNCKSCEKACLMKVEVRKNINSAECIRCGKCIDACPKKAIQVRFGFSKKNPDEI